MMRGGVMGTSSAIAMAQDILDLQGLRRRHGDGERLEFCFFWGHVPAKGLPAGTLDKACFSQWSEQGFELNGLHYKTAEHFMMASKAELFGDLSTRDLVLKAPGPKEAKGLGRAVRGFDEAVWERERSAIVLQGNLAKFSQHPKALDVLAETGTSILVEASPYDRLWGIGMGATDPGASDPARWRGLNLLGFVLMATRQRLCPQPDLDSNLGSDLKDGPAPVIGEQTEHKAKGFKRFARPR